MLKLQQRPFFVLACTLLLAFVLSSTPRMFPIVGASPVDQQQQQQQDSVSARHSDDDAQQHYHDAQSHVSFHPLRMNPADHEDIGEGPSAAQNAPRTKRHFRKPTGHIRAEDIPPHQAVDTTTTPRSATFSTHSVGRRSILTTPGLRENHVHPERFDGQFIQPRFKKQILKDLTIAATEFQGTLLFLLIAFIGSNPAASVNEVALSYAMGLLATIIHHSSSQANPSVSVLQAALGKLSPRQAAMNIGAQITASIAASGIQTLACGETWSVAQLTVSPARGLLVETVLSTVLFTTVLWVSAMPSVQKATMPFLISLIFLGCELAGIRVSSASLNSARQLGPAIISGRWHHYDYIYHVAPAIAVPLSLLIFKANQLLQAPDAEPSDVGPGQLVDTYRLQRRRQLRDENDEV